MGIYSDSFNLLRQRGQFRSQTRETTKFQKNLKRGSASTGFARTTTKRLKDPTKSIEEKELDFTSEMYTQNKKDLEK